MLKNNHQTFSTDIKTHNKVTVNIQHGTIKTKPADQSRGGYFRNGSLIH